jgi:hypothetical protein
VAGVGIFNVCPSARLRFRGEIVEDLLKTKRESPLQHRFKVWVERGIAPSLSGNESDGLSSLKFIETV